MNFPTTHSPEFIKIPVNPRSSLTFILTFLIISPNSTHSQSSFSSAIDESSSSDSVTKFQPSLAVVIGVLSIVFSLSILVLIYAKCCRISSSIHQESFGNLLRTRSRFSGIDKRIIESLPSFKFSMLKGWKNGLECSVCLSAFEDVEILRLLPKCKHAFHINCIDQWLEKHSSCPLCRFKVIEEDIALFTYSNSLRFHEPEFEPSSLELFIEREGSSRFGPKIELTEDDQDQEILHKFNHRIMIVGDHDPIILKNRWSSLTSSDLLFLKSEMITCMSSNRFDRHPSPENKRNSDGGDGEDMDSGGRRSVSEITIHPRFLETPVRVEDERLRSVWLPIARETVQRFAHKENRSAPNGQRLKVDPNLEELWNV
ncbi:E3 ubiquitin-protein ligase ATL42-like [Cynara cardunculus var. scolymus]|uniref:RING-type E3 ubiquitin transferase n=1 Tax=Cynara cardunculus var. scolymus TaxID=59895 RepID=A0A103Y2C7_CYNCS|nr:E3 ubiquitin-protein ligase ATL42-like [Cynara cardunculus var. scolymus]KVI01239.1 Zinc finger, RING/FYVE/PHD-type [Cynara cardunculus var. scolymus]